MGKAILEETKQKISELYRTSDLSTASISQALGVSERTAQRYKNYDGLDTSRPTRPSETSPTSPSSHDKALDMTGKPRPTSQGDQALEGPGGPSHNEADQALDITERPSRTRPDVEPRRINFVGGKKFKNKRPEKEDSEDEPEYECNECGAVFDTPAEYCPECGTELNLEDYEEQAEDNEEPTSREDQEGSEEIDSNKESSGLIKESEKEEPEEEEEIDYQCGGCNAIFKTPFEYCPECGTKLEYEFDYYCTECGYEFNGDLKRCPSCGDKFD